ncbi:MAG: hypothetical protein H6R26_1421 [Proteobacteria bacterium]|nr:hypothetical protein [Pseudomonadota bacterium]
MLPAEWVYNFEDFRLIPFAKSELTIAACGGEWRLSIHTTIDRIARGHEALDLQERKTNFREQPRIGGEQYGS